MKKIYLKYAIALVGGLSVLNSCVKEDEWSTPPINCNNKFAAPNISLADFVAQSPASGAAPKKITTDMIFDAYVVSSDEQGNFYKTISFQDKPENPTVGLQIEVNKSSNFADLPVGSHIRINANGLVLGYDRGVIKLGAVDPDYPIGRVPEVLVGRYISGVCNGNGLEVVNLVPLQLPSLDEARKDKYINTLVKVQNVQFADSEQGKKYINYESAGAGVDTDRNIIDMTNGKAVLRTSGFAKFGATVLPTGSGELTFVVSKYNSSYQMIIRNLNDVKFTSPRFTLNIIDFENYTVNDNVIAPYSNVLLAGNGAVKWRVVTFSNNKYIQVSANGTPGDLKNQFAVPVTFNGQNKLSFKTNAGYYNGETLKVYWSLNYNPANPTAATLNDITSLFDISKGIQPPVGTGANYEASFRSSGLKNLPGAATGTGYLIFEYTGKGTAPIVSTTMQLDDINLL